MFSSLWHFRGFIWNSVLRDQQLRYRRSALGILWTIAQPLALILIYSVVFGRVMRHPGMGEGAFDYPVYLCSGILTWSLFSDVLSRLTTVFNDNAHLLRKVQLPKLSFPVIAVGACLLNFAMVMAVFLVFLILVGRVPGISLLGLLPVVAVQVAFALGLGVVLGSVNVFFRDVQQALGIALQLWFWLTPIVYVPSILSESTVALLSWNPMWPVMAAYRDIFLNNQWPDWATLLYPAALSVLLLAAGFVVFKRLQHDILDEV